MNSPSAPQSYTGIVGPGQTLPVAVVGTQFYFPVATGQFFARQSGGLWCAYVQGTGQECTAQFSQVEINNPTTSPLVFQIVASGSSFIDHRLVSNQGVTNVLVPLRAPWTGPTGPNNLFTNTILDLSGQTIVDAQVRTWIAIQRVAFYVQVVSSQVGGQILGDFGDIGNTPAPVAFTASGNFAVTYEPPSPSTILGGGVFEIYQAIAPGYGANPPN